MDIEMIDRVSKAIREELAKPQSNGYCMFVASDEESRAIAKAAIKVMRQPTSYMYDYLGNMGVMYKDNNSYGIWVTYIDAIIGD